MLLKFPASSPRITKTRLQMCAIYRKELELCWKEQFRMQKLAREREGLLVEMAAMLDAEERQIREALANGAEIV
jgi:hypothetical protein